MILKYMNRIRPRSEKTCSNIWKTFTPISNIDGTFEIERNKYSNVPHSGKHIGPVAEFYAGRSVFISGGTGFLGKAIIEKLLYSCPKIEKIFVLVRANGKMAPEERMKSFVDDRVFTRIRNTRPEDMKKVVLASGDIAARKLGLRERDQRILEEEVSIVIHSAATVRFDEPLNIAWKVNVEGTKKMLELSQRMKNLEAFVHISTAYTNPDREVIEEVLYPAPATFSNILASVKKGVTGEETLQLIKGRPNTYTFTKALAEHVVAENHGIVPLVIIRPSVVTSAKEIPMKGWLENWYGCTGFIMDVALGWNRIVYGKPNNIVDMIPVDYVTNTVIVAGARYDKSKHTPIYNCCSSDTNPITLGQLFDGFCVETNKYNNSTTFMPIIYSSSKGVVWLVTLFLQILPAYMADCGRLLTGKRPKNVKKQSMAIQNHAALSYFTSRSWVMKSAGTRRLHAGLSQEDQKEFPCDPTDIDWNQYLKDYFWGVKKYLEKKDMNKN